MGKHGIRLYQEELNDPKIGLLTDRLYRLRIELFLLASELGAGGRLPPLANIAWRLRIDEDELLADLQELAKVNIVASAETATIFDDFIGRGWAITNFAAYQSPIPSPYPPSFNAELKEAIRERDSHKCTTCERDGYIVHHHQL